MSGIQGKNGRNIDKLAVKESSVPSVGFKNVRFLHEAAAGDETISLLTLTTPADATANGFVQPSLSDLQKVSLRQFKNNLTLKTGTGVLIQDIDFVVSGASTIKLLVPALEGQIFEGVINAEPRVGTTLLDAKPLAISGTLSAGAVDFNVGEPFKVGDNINRQIGSVMVFVDNQIAYRNVGNQPDGEGDYYEVHSGAGLGTIIRFNNTDSEDRGIVVVSVGALVERPDGAQDAVIDQLAGEIENLREILEEVIEEPIPAGSATNPDLKAFGDRVLTAEEQLAAVLGLNIFTQEAQSIYKNNTGVASNGGFVQLTTTSSTMIGDDLIEVIDRSASGNTQTIFRAKKKCMMHINMSGDASTVGTFLVFNKYSVGDTTGVADVSISYDESGGHTPAGDRMGCNGTIELDEGEFVGFTINGNFNGGSSASFVATARSSEKRTIKDILGI